MPTYTENGFYIDESILPEWEHDNKIVKTLQKDDNVLVTTLEYKPYVTTTASWDNTSRPKHFNCKRCGAPNQVDVCEYCGSAAEE